MSLSFSIQNVKNGGVVMVNSDWSFSHQCAL